LSCFAASLCASFAAFSAWSFAVCFITASRSASRSSAFFAAASRALTSSRMRRMLSIASRIEAPRIGEVASPHAGSPAPFTA
jgi:hypothetical protein